MMTMESPFQAAVLKGKVVLITGGGSRIGYPIWQRCTSVAIVGRRKQALDSAVSALQALGFKAADFEKDIRKQEDAKRVMKSAKGLSPNGMT